MKKVRIAKGKKKQISIDEIAKIYTDPKLFKNDCLDLALKMRTHMLKYGYVGIWTVEELFKKLWKNY